MIRSTAARAGATAPVACLLALLLAAPAGAADAPAHPDADRLGSTVAAHEGAAPRTAASPPEVTAAGAVRGMDVSHWQGTVDWRGARAAGARFAYVKATEGVSYRDPRFSANYSGSYGAGLVRGAYHFALPDRSSGTVQADWFVSHGGGWSPDGRTLPPLLDLEYNPYGSTCYGLSAREMVGWVRAFSARVKARTGRHPAIYTTTDWWRQCTGNDATFAGTHPLFIARYNSTVGTLPAGWRFYTFWQYADSGPLPGDQDVFNGSLTQLQTLARG